MRIVHIEDFFHPEAGYQVNLLSRLQVQQGHEVFVVTAEMDKIPDYLTAFFGRENMPERDEKFYQLTGVKVIRIPLKGFYSGRAIFPSKIFKLVDSLKPDVALIHGIDTLTGMRFMRKSGRLKYPLVTDNHMLEMASTNKFRNLFRFFFRWLVTPYVLRNEIPVIRLVDSDYVEKFLGIPLAKTALLSFGTDTDYFTIDTSEKIAFRQKYGISENDFVVVYAGKLDVFKGGKFLAESIQKKFITQNGKEIIFLIIGSGAGEYGKEVENLFNSSANSILRFPTQTYFNLKDFYQAADLAIYPKQCSMSFFEAQSCGLPVVFENNEINAQRAQFGNAFVFNAEDCNDFRNKILQCAEMNETDYATMKQTARNYICENYNFVPIAQKYTDIMQNEMRKFAVRKVK